MNRFGVTSQVYVAIGLDSGELRIYEIKCSSDIDLEIQFKLPQSHLQISSFVFLKENPFDYNTNEILVLYEDSSILLVFFNKNLSLLRLRKTETLCLKSVYNVYPSERLEKMIYFKTRLNNYPIEYRYCDYLYDVILFIGTDRNIYAFSWNYTVKIIGPFDDAVFSRADASKKNY